jgi:hypothetical protein
MCIYGCFLVFSGEGCMGGEREHGYGLEDIVQLEYVP